MRHRLVTRITLPVLLSAALAACGGSSPAAVPQATGSAGGSASSAPSAPASGSSPFSPPGNVYADQTAANLQPFLRSLPPRVYVPNSDVNTVSVIDPKTFTVLYTFTTGKAPQHVVPSYDLKSLWVNNNGANTVTRIDPTTGRPTVTLNVPDPYNMYFTPDGRYAIDVAEALQVLYFRDPQTLAPAFSVPVSCKGVNHMDFSADGSYLLASCEFSGKVVKVDLATHRQVGSLNLGSAKNMPQDVRLSPDGKVFYVADMVANGVWVVDGATMRQVGFIPTGPGAHGLYPSRNGKRIFVTNRGTSHVYGLPGGPGSISVLDPATGKITANWPIPGGGSPDMGNLSTDGSQLWLSGRYDNVVYCIDTSNGHLLAKIPVGLAPHGLTYWPQPGRFSLGHTGNMR